uniref:Uncharacterized protein n=1 Tax=Anopheles stephensi TaxID=30069 RepID=A0A182YGH2_ANOST
MRTPFVRRAHSTIGSQQCPPNKTFDAGVRQQCTHTRWKAVKS